MASKIRNFLLRVYLEYDSIYPAIKNQRGATRLKSSLRDLVYRLHIFQDDEKFIKYRGIKMMFSDEEFLNAFIHEREFLDLISNSSYDTFIDIGSYQGFYSVFGKKISPESEVHCFEISPENVEKLKDNIEANNLSGQIYINEYGLWSKEKTTTAKLSDNGKSKVKTGTSQIKLKTLDSYIYSERLEPDLIKLDVEGAELEVLKGSSKTLEEFKPDILLELHKDERLEEFDHETEDVINFLAKRGYIYKKLKEGKYDDLYHFHKPSS